MKYCNWKLAAALTLLAAIRAHAQALPPDTLTLDTFTTNANGWFVGEEGARAAALTPAGYRVYVPAGGSGSLATAYFGGLHLAGDYRVEATVQLRGTAGLVLALRPPNGSQEYRILLVGPERVQVLHIVPGSGPAVEADQALPAGFDPARPHELAVARTGPELRYLLDGKPVGPPQPAPTPPAGTDANLGFMVRGAGAELTCRRWLVRHRSGIRLAPGVPRNLRRERLAGLSQAGMLEAVNAVSADGRYLYFGRRPMGGKQYGDIYRAERRADGNWGPAEQMPTPVSTPLPDDVAAASPDGQTLVLRGVFDPATGTRTTAEGLAQTTRQPDGSWGRPTPYAPGLELPGANYLSYFVDASGTVALVSGDAASHPGNKELYVSVRRADGSWPPLTRLGAPLNTPGDEYAAFLAPDGKTLYFASDGHPGYGDLDIFVSTRLDDTWTRWSEPLNLGPGVNTPRFECYFQVGAAGDYAYLSSAEPGSAGDYDLYRLQLPPAVRPAPTVLVRGRVLDARTNEPVPGATLRYEVLPAGTQAGRLQLSGLGSYEIALPAGRPYGFGASAPGYVAAYDNLELGPADTGTREQDLYLLPLTEPTATLAATPVAVQVVGSAAPPPPPRPVAVAATPPAATPSGPAPAATVAPAPAPVPPPADPLATAPRLVLRNLFFVRGLPKLLPASFPELDRLAGTLRDNPGLHIRLEGHTDNTGDDVNPQPNQTLSEQRAAAVRDYLTSHGIAAGRLGTAGYGGGRPVAPNTTEANKARNRRVELVIVSR